MKYHGPRDYRLFHYTRKKAHLVAMLSDGLWPRFSEEEFTWIDDAPDLYLAFPMVCFCDIPIAAAKQHRERYGRYAIAVHKNYADELDIAPVWYIRTGGRHSVEIRKYLPRNPRFTLEGARGSALLSFLPLMKLAVGTQPSRQRPGTHEAMDFVEECEWRHVPAGLSSDNWRLGYRRKFVTDADHEKTKSLKIQLRPDMIEAVYVRTTRDVRDLRRAFPSFAGKIRRWPK